MPSHGVINHLPEFGRFESRGFAKKMLVHIYLADVVQVTRRTQLSRLRGGESYGFCNGRSITAHAQGMPAHVYMFCVNGGRKSFEGFFPKRMDGSDQAQVLGGALLQRHHELMIVDGKSDQRPEFPNQFQQLWGISCAFVSFTQHHRTHQLSPDL